jgi:hypothetical protein
MADARGESGAVPMSASTLAAAPVANPTAPRPWNHAARGEVIVAGQRGPRRRRQRRADAHGVARLEVGVLCAGANAHTHRHLLTLQRLDRGNADGEALAAHRTRLDQLDEARHLDRAGLMLKDGGAHALGAQLGSGDAASKRQQPGGNQRAGPLPFAGQEQRQGRGHGQQCV